MFVILIDVKIRGDAENPDEPDIPDVISDLRKKLNCDAQGRKYIDVFVLSHPDQDHCLGLNTYFHLGTPDSYSKKDDKIFICEIWSSPMVFRRASKALTLCDDAKALNKEAKRRVQYYRDYGLKAMKEGDRIQIMGEDEDCKFNCTSVVSADNSSRKKPTGTTVFIPPDVLRKPNIVSLATRLKKTPTQQVAFT